MGADARPTLGAFSTLSIGVGGMVGGGIFAVTGLSIDVTHGAAPLAFALAGLVAWLTGYSYLVLTWRYPGEGGTVEFLNRAFGGGLVTGAANILLLQSYVVLLAVYAYAFGSYGAAFFPPSERDFGLHALASGVIVGLVLLSVFGSRLVIRSENLMNVAKLVLLAAFVGVGLATPMEWSRLAPESWATPLGVVSGAMLIFLNYEGFELIANASREVADPKRSLPIAYLGGIGIVIVLYAGVVAVVVGHLSFDEVARVSDHVLSIAAHDMAGRPGFLVIAAAALLATSSAINATFFSTGRLAYSIARSGELPAELERSIRGQHLEGTLVTAGLALLLVNLAPLDAIAAMGSAGFLLVFTALNLAAIRLRRETGGRAWLSALAALSTGAALVALCLEVDENPATRSHLWILVGLVATSIGIEAAYRRATGRTIRLAEASGAPRRGSPRAGS